MIHGEENKDTDSVQDSNSTGPEETTKITDESSPSKVDSIQPESNTGGTRSHTDDHD